MTIVLVLAAHMDDETLGCGGTIARHAAQGDEVHVCFMTDSSTTQYAGDASKLAPKYEQAREAAAILGIAQLHHLDFPDMKLDTVSIPELASAVAAIVRSTQAELIFTHHPGDRNKDHCLTYEASMVAARPYPGQTIRRVVTYEVLSSTEWGEQHLPFVPNHFVDVAAHVETKAEAMACYRDEVRDPPHPRSIEAIRVHARDRGMSVGLEYAEAFSIVYDIER